MRRAPHPTRRALWMHRARVKIHWKLFSDAPCAYPNAPRALELTQTAHELEKSPLNDALGSQNVEWVENEEK